jgi:anaerobic selenocysteine-containing dehydrogenase
MEHRANGAMAFRTIGCLPGLTGAWRKRGGGLLYMTYELFLPSLADQGMLYLQHKSIRSINDRSESESPDEGTRARGPVLRCPGALHDRHRAIRRLHLPRNDAGRTFGRTGLLGLAVALNLPAANAAGEAAPNTEFFRRLAKRLGLTEPYLYETDEQLARNVLRTGHPYLNGITYERLVEEVWPPLNLPEPWVPFAKAIFHAFKEMRVLFRNAPQAGQDPCHTMFLVPPARKTIR